MKASVKPGQMCTATCAESEESFLASGKRSQSRHRDMSSGGGVPEIRVPFWGNLIIRILIFGGLCWVSLLLENTIHEGKALFSPTKNMQHLKR